jgi:hypothetical protein
MVRQASGMRNGADAIWPPARVWVRPSRAENTGSDDGTEVVEGG